MSRVIRLLQDCLDRYVAARGGEISHAEAEAMVTRLAPLAEAAIRAEKATDGLVKSAKKREKAAYKSMKRSLRRSEKRRKAQLNKARADKSCVGYANGFDPLASYSPKPYRSARGGFHGKLEN